MDQVLRQTILSHVTEAIRKSVHISDLDVALDTRLSDDLALDSLDRVEVAMSLEETLDVEFPQDAIRQFDVVSDIVAYLVRRFFRDVDEQLLERASLISH